jgi:hypothetical protein
VGVKNSSPMTKGGQGGFPVVQPSRLRTLTAPSFSYLLLAVFRHELPARGLLFLTRQRRAFFGRWFCARVRADANLWLVALPTLLAPVPRFTITPYSTAWAQAGAPGARARHTTIRTITRSLFTTTILSLP